jgi:hypothetical protein
MKYALLIYPKPGSHEELSPEDYQVALEEYRALAAEDYVLAGEGLEPVDTATTVRRNGVDTLVTDGPFANTKEVLGGFYLIDADDLDRAIAAAERIPAVRLGGAVEVRPVREYPR